ncbi:DNA (cytosine-5-)-methyltransferase [Limnoraphis robusta]|uniref:Cytosine-specific methyltransferase n=1 Tax=Limnoraphis robusta CCNP1315 TaxID=3110306 RepID=A0ABU5TSG4_9CYAN|nr:DNA (cytosine-5-)-methyltransferase [Limnoraphis robusta]MEA5517729.1 DNA (cytosine-5-)-methyltransferase [Limnoraphis robusta CCNP1315]MEA5546280.1 DNA (cytosine-5-)-methyltransferase [Limnoraphis robusta CCNP1324]
MKAIELFAGIGGFRLGMEAANIETVWANDSSELSCRVYQSNFGESSIVLGDITQIDCSGIPQHDLLTAGFPCQPFSPAGKKQGIRDQVRGTLFERIVEIIASKQPQYFLLENVKRILTMEQGYHFRVILKALASLDYLIEWRLINPLNFGIPQNRHRVFIIGTKYQNQNNLPSLEEYSILLTQQDCEDLAITQPTLAKYLQPILLDKSSKNCNWGIAYQNQIYTQQIPALSQQKPPNKLKDILQDEREIDIQFDFTADTRERIKKSTSVHRYCNGVEILYNQDGGARLGYTIFGVNGIASTLTASISRHYERYQVGNQFRRLTNIEYARLMGFPDDWCRVARVYDQYKLYGNAVVPVCVEWICQRIGQQNIQLNSKIGEQLKLPI